jgi:hypothetical protein
MYWPIKAGSFFFSLITCISYVAMNGPALVDDAQLVEKKIHEPNLEITVE